MTSSERLPYRPKDYTAAAWHRARLDLMGFMRNEGRWLPEKAKLEARRLYGTHDRARKQERGETEAQYRTHLADTRPMLARHHTPPWAINAPAYVEEIYLFLAEAGKLVSETETQELKRAA
jgi:hypothetical protein